MRLVVDASVLVKVLTAEPGSARATVLLGDAEERIAPDLIAVEIASALSKKVRRDGLPSDLAASLLRELDTLLDRTVPDSTLIDAALTLSLELGHALQDCVYLALAIEEDAKLATADAKFAAKVVASRYRDRIAPLALG